MTSTATTITPIHATRLPHNTISGGSRCDTRVQIPDRLQVGDAGSAVVISCLLHDFVYDWRLEPLDGGQATRISVHVAIPDEKVEHFEQVTLDRQDRSLWDTREIGEGVRVLHSALTFERAGRYQIEAAIAALHDDAASAEETDWPQILAWYDDLVALT